MSQKRWPRCGPVAMTGSTDSCGCRCQSRMFRRALKRCATGCARGQTANPPSHAGRAGKTNRRASPSRTSGANPLRLTGRPGAQGIMESVETTGAGGLAHWKVSVTGE
jgi:hypothetical protein